MGFLLPPAWDRTGRALMAETPKLRVQARRKRKRKRCLQVCLGLHFERGFGRTLPSDNGQHTAAASTETGILQELTTPRRLDHLRALEAESIYIMREAVAEFARPVMLYSIGKDSSVMLRSSGPEGLYCRENSISAMHIDTSYKFDDDDRVSR